MDPEEKEDSNEFGKVIDALHNKQKLPSLRTYQGDMAEFIKSKNESVISISVKEKERKEEKREEEIKEEKLGIRPKQGTKNFQFNFNLIVLSLVLIFAGAFGLYYVFGTLKKPVEKQEVVLKEQIIPYNSSVVLNDATSSNLGAEIGKLSFSNGINIIKISAGGVPIEKAKDFFSFLEVSLPAALERTLKDDYTIGMISQDKEHSPFMIITVNDYGSAFSAMLDWEGNMEKDLSFLNTATSTEVFAWKDIIIKNKDTRGLVNQNDESRITYTFLDKNTILIVGDISVIGEISSAYASRSVAR
jgi:hypothetical protein